MNAAQQLLTILLVSIAAALLVSGCVEQPAKDAAPPECGMPMDCEGRIHVQCVGAWQCLAGKCSWECSGQHLELPKEEEPGMTG